MPNASSNPRRCTTLLSEFSLFDGAFGQTDQNANESLDRWAPQRDLGRQAHAAIDDVGPQKDRCLAFGNPMGRAVGFVLQLGRQRRQIVGILQQQFQPLARLEFGKLGGNRIEALGRRGGIEHGEATGSRLEATGHMEGGMGSFSFLRCRRAVEHKTVAFRLWAFGLKPRVPGSGPRATGSPTALPHSVQEPS